MAKKERPAYTPEQLDTIRQVFTSQLLTSATLIFNATEAEEPTDEDLKIMRTDAADQAICLMEEILEQLEGMTIQEV